MKWCFAEVFEKVASLVPDRLALINGDTRRTVAHVTHLTKLVRRACNACEAPPTTAPDLVAIPATAMLKLVLGLLETLSPLHDPHRGRTPAWIDSWFAADEAGQDMTAVTL